MEPAVRDRVAGRFPSTRFQGSKRKLLGALAATLGRHSRGTAIDLYSGSGSVSLLLRTLGFRVVANDYLRFANNTAAVFLGATPQRLGAVDWGAKLRYLLLDAPIPAPPLVHERFRGVFFTCEENLAIDRFCQNVIHEAEFTRAVLTYAVGQGLLMKRPYNLFHRANLYMRLNDVRRTFGNAVTWGRPIAAHALKAIAELGGAALQPGSACGHAVTYVNTSQLASFPEVEPTLVYLDPPYVARDGTAVDYADFYHFLEGLLDYRLFASGDSGRPHRPIVAAPTRWRSCQPALAELAEICAKWPRASIFLSYREDGLPSVSELRECFARSGRLARVRCIVPYRYALSHSRSSREILLSAAPPRGRHAGVKRVSVLA
jgi:adenine-specific DNA-methyltransferase